jgi:hypothetical protein
MCGGGWQVLEESLQLNDVSDGFKNERRLKLFFDSRVVGLKEFSELTCNPDNKGESTF